MKKVYLLLAMFFFLFGAAGCSNQPKLPFDNFAPEKVKKEVYDWQVYTNPAYRYEIRVPKNWISLDSGEDGKWVKLSGSLNDPNPGLLINAYTNSVNAVSLDDFYKKQPIDYLTQGYEKEDVKVSGVKGIRFKNVSMPGTDNFKADLIILDLSDRYLEIFLNPGSKEANIILSSIKFYGNNIISDLPGVK